ncbi:MAG: SH3 domain-containing protein [Chloroflexota bacterium]|nr:SH3 domain-containing protein [Chloroflexota bacterium]
MSSTHSGGSRRPIWRSLGAAAAALLVILLVALPAAAESHGSQLADASVSPRAGTTATSFTFAVGYRVDGAPSPRVFVLIDGVAHSMAYAGGDASGTRMRFTFSTRLPAGRHAIAFRGQTGADQTDEMAGGSVSVDLAAPVARPTPKPTPKAPRPAPKPTPKTPSEPAHSSGGSGGSSSGGGGTSPGSGPSGGDGPSAGSGSGGTEAAFSGGFGGGAFGSGDLVGNAGAATDGKPARSAQQAASGPAGATGTSGGSEAGRGWGDLSLYLQALGIGGSGPTRVGLLPSIVGSAGAMTVVMAFMFFGKRRRDGDPPEPDEVLEAAAARGSGRAPGGELVPDNTFVMPGLLDAEAAMPRWRRPSLLEARKMDPLRMVGVAAPQSFQHGAVGPRDGHERRLIRYSVVSLLDTPDELHAREIGHIGRGDEVQLLDRSGSYWRVLCPDGREGWIHKMTLGEVVGEPPAPNARDTWATSSVDIDDVDSDVLTAFMAARGRA